MKLFKSNKWAVISTFHVLINAEVLIREERMEGNQSYRQGDVDNQNVLEARKVYVFEV